MWPDDPIVALVALVVLLAVLAVLAARQTRSSRREPGQFGAGDLEEWLGEIRPPEGRHRGGPDPEEDR